MRPATINIPRPCLESWATMTPTATGRHCASCRTTVIDFTEKTDAEVMAHFQQVRWGGTCGRFRVGQLDRPLRPAATAAAGRWSSAWRTWPALTLSIWLSRETATPAAQAQLPTEQWQPQPPAYLRGGPATELRLRGIVVDSVGQGVPGATVLLAGTDIGTSTDVDGRFVLVFPTARWQADKSEVTFSFVGYHSARVPLTSKPSPAGEPIRVVLLENKQLLVEQKQVITAGGAFYRRPWPWHPRAFWFWLSRPFRR